MGQFRQYCTNCTKPALILCVTPSHCKYPTKRSTVLKLV
nr:MAG TPA: hypothetical protein [Caudoviricetes sp.]